MDLSKLTVLYDSKPMSPMRIALVDEKGVPFRLATEARIVIDVRAGKRHAEVEVVGLENYVTDSEGRIQLPAQLERHGALAENGGED